MSLSPVCWSVALLRDDFMSSLVDHTIAHRGPMVWLQTRCMYALWPFGFGFADL